LLLIGRFLNISPLKPLGQKLLTKFRLIWPNGFREKQLYKSTNQKQELPVVAMFISLLTDREKMCNLYRGPSINASYQVWIDLAKRFQRRRFFYISTNQNL
jgi:hypothetical protein